MNWTGEGGMLIGASRKHDPQLSVTFCQNMLTRYERDKHATFAGNLVYGEFLNYSIAEIHVRSLEEE